MLTKLIEKQLRDSHDRNSNLFEQKNIRFFTTFDQKEDWESVEIDFALFRNVNEFFVYLLSDLSPENSCISQVINLVDMEKIRISYISDAYLCLVFDNSDPESVKKARCIAEHTNHFVEEIVSEVKGCGGKIDYFTHSIFPQNKTYLSIDLPVVKSFQKSMIKEEDNRYMNMSLKDLIKAVTLLKKQERFSLLPKRHQALIKQAIAVKKKQLKNKEVIKTAS